MGEEKWRGWGAKPFAPQKERGVPTQNLAPKGGLDKNNTFHAKSWRGYEMLHNGILYNLDTMYRGYHDKYYVKISRCVTFLFMATSMINEYSFVPC